MSEEPGEQEPVESIFEDKVRVVEGIVDRQLGVFSSYAQDHPDFTLSVTLDVHGSVITGELIGRNAWFDEVERRYSAQLPGLPAAMSQLGKREADDESPDSFIHLRDARRVTGDVQRPRALEDSAFMWRGRIGSVDGWNIGYLTFHED